MTKNKINVLDSVKEDFTTPVSFYDGKYTKTTQFMLPAVGINIHNRLIFNFFINSYLEDKGKRHEYIRPIFILFGVKDFKDREWQKVYNALVKSPNYAGDYDCGIQDNKNLVMMVFKIPDEFEADYYKFKRGKYSQFSQKYKEKFPKYVGDEEGVGKESTLWRIIHKSPDLKREIEEEFGMPEGELDKPTDGIMANEIWDIPRKEREYYRYGYEKEIAVSG